MDAFEFKARVTLPRSTFEIGGDDQTIDEMEWVTFMLVAMKKARTIPAMSRCLPTYISSECDLCKKQSEGGCEHNRGNQGAVQENGQGWQRGS
jgi:hypothetical protein